MASYGNQVKNGKAFEYAVALQYFRYISQAGLPIEWVENTALKNARRYYEDFSLPEQQQFDNAAYNTIASLIKIEPGLVTQGKNGDVLRISLINDSAGEYGDVRDIILSHSNPKWEIGFSAKNNNDAVKHSRLGKELDFGKKWLNYPCSLFYWEDVKPIFEFIEEHIGLRHTWNDLGQEKENKVYEPLLRAFRKEILLLSEKHEDVPQKLIEYLIGNKPFYKIIKDDSHNMVVVKAYNIKGELNKPYMKEKSAYSVPKIDYPTRIVEFEFKKDSKNTLNMILDGGWEISFRLHNASTYVERSLKFDIKLLGNPPILFTQYLFQ